MDDEEQQPQVYRNQEAIRSYERFVESFRCYDWVKGAVPGLMDLDAVLERRGDVLVLEGKHRRGNKIHVPLGQFLTLKALSRFDGIEVWLVAEAEDAKSGPGKGFSVIDVRELERPDFELRENGSRMWGFYCRGPHGRKRGWIQTDLDGLRDMLREWWTERD